MRRRYRWEEIAQRARSTPGVWRLHPDLIAVTDHLELHAKRRVDAFDPTPDGRYRFRRGRRGYNEMGAVVFDLRIRYEPKESPDEQQDP